MANEVKIIGIKSLDKKLKALGIDSEAVAKKAVSTAALKIQSEAITSIQRGARNGKVYKRGSRTHQASAPYEAPKTDTGNLVSNISIEKSTDGLSAKVGIMSQRAIYGAWLEFGTSKMKPRPWLLPAFLKKRDEAEKDFFNELKKLIRSKTVG